MAVHGRCEAVDRVEGARDGGEAVAGGSGEDLDAVEAEGACGAVAVLEGELGPAEAKGADRGADRATLDAQEERGRVRDVA